MRLFPRLFCLLSCLFVSVIGAQTRSADASAGAAMAVTLGESAVNLDGPWTFHIGDSPVAAGSKSYVWAQPNVDDSTWETVSLTPNAGAFDPTLGIPLYVPGWTARGHAGYSGDAWYRIRIQVTAKPGQRLAIEGPSNVDDAYQVFANGTLLGSFGTFFEPGKRPRFYVTRPAIFYLPVADAGTGSASTLVLAFHVYMDAGTLQSQPDVGGMHIAPTLGLASTIQAQHRLAWADNIHTFVSYPIIAFLMVMMAIIAFSIAFFDRSDHVYWWLATVFLVTAAAEIHLGLLVWTEFEVAHGFVFTMMNPIILGLWVMIWWTWFRLTRPIWVPKLIFALTVSYQVCYLLGQGLFEIHSHAVLAALGAAWLLLRFVILGLFIYILIRGIRKQGMEGWLALPAAILVGITQFQEELGVLHVRVIYFPLGVQLSLGDVANLALLAAMLVLLVRRLRISIAHQREMALDVKQAQEVQHVLLIEPIKLPRLAIEIEYRPAREVGGDFLQILPHASDGSVLIVVGDVAGKGLQAGMLVALLVGSIRSMAEMDDNPANILHALNRRLLGRGGALATCLAMRVEASGAVTLYNAGHLPPFLNGVEMIVEGALPLGADDEAEFPVNHFSLQPSDRLLLMSDGIAEAQDRSGQLLGFERVTEFLSTPRSAADIATLAQTFGQQDDISVVSVVCVA